MVLMYGQRSQAQEVQVSPGQLVNGFETCFIFNSSNIQASSNIQEIKLIYQQF